MNKHIILNTLLALSSPSIYNFSAISALAQGQPPQPSISNQEVTIPQSSAITVTFPAAVTFDAGKKNSLPMAALLNQPLLDSSGNIVVPVNSPVSIQLQPTKGGAQIKAEALVIQGRIIPIQALGPWIPGSTVTTVSSAQQAQVNQIIFSSLGGSVLGILGSATGASRDEITNFTNVGSYVGTGLGVIAGLFSPKKIRQVQIAQGSMYILTLQVPVTIPPQVVQAKPPTPPPATPTPAATPAKPSTPPPATPTPAATPAKPSTPPPATPTPAATPAA